MYSFITLATLFTAVLAAPTKKTRQEYPVLSFTVSNDDSGAHSSSSILADGNAVTFYHDFAGTAIDSDDTIWATSIQATSNAAGIVCTVSDYDGNQVGLLTEQSTFVDLDGQDTAVVTDVSAFTLVCEQL